MLTVNQVDPEALKGLSEQVEQHLGHMERLAIRSVRAGGVSVAPIGYLETTLTSVQAISTLHLKLASALCVPPARTDAQLAQARTNACSCLNGQPQLIPLAR